MDSKIIKEKYYFENKISINFYLLFFCLIEINKNIRHIYIELLSF